MARNVPIRFNEDIITDAYMPCLSPAGSHHSSDNIALVTSGDSSLAKHRIKPAASGYSRQANLFFAKLGSLSVLLM